MAKKMITQGVVNRDLNAALRVELALKLRAQRLTYHEIAQKAGYGSASAARTAIKRELERRVNHAVDELRREEADMLDRLHAQVWPLAIGNPDANQAKERTPNLFAVDRVLAISVARREMLGLDVKGDAPPGQVLIQEYPPGVVEAV